MKRNILIIIFLAIFGGTLPVNAVTEKEMQQARAIAAQAYLRYANDGSGYLDDVHPKSMAELEKSLKPKEKENLKAFKAIPVPNDYASWDKAKLVEYWGVKAFANKGLSEKGRIGRLRAKKRIGAMTVSAPSKQEQKTPKPEEKKPAEKKAEQPKAAPVVAPENTTSSVSPAQDPATEAVVDSLMSQAEAAEKLAAEGLDEEPLKKAENHTWVYIVILCILVGVVVALVVFASNVMKRNPERMPVREPEQSRNQEPGTSPAAGNRKLEAAIAEKNAVLNEKNREVAMLNKKVEELNSENSALKRNLESLTGEIASLRKRLTEAGAQISKLETRASAASAEHAHQEARASQAMQSQPEAASPASAVAQPRTQPQTQAPQRPHAKTPLRTIYLGRANAKGIFVRADRMLNLGNSIFRLDTTDGYAGTFRVADNPTVWEMALLTPRENLAGACVSADLDNTEGMSRIVNDSAGTAIFEGGCWKVIRKAKIHYE